MLGQLAVLEQRHSRRDSPTLPSRKHVVRVRQLMSAPLGLPTLGALVKE
jgi:hypothetical protein